MCILCMAHSDIFLSLANSNKHPMQQTHSSDTANKLNAPKPNAAKTKQMIPARIFAPKELDLDLIF